MPKTTSNAIVAKFGDMDKCLAMFNPDRQAEYCRFPERCITGAAPTLGMLCTAYGNGTAKAWLTPQLYNLSEFCGCKGKLSSIQIRELASCIADRYNWLKVTELMLFFYRFKFGDYGKFYGNVDPMAIMAALKDFIAYRNGILDNLDARRKERQWEEWKRRAISHDDYLKQQKTESQ